MAKRGKWKLYLDPVKAGGPYILTVTSQDGVITLKNILFGDIWLATGQSNMETDIKYYKEHWPDMYKEIPGTYRNDKIRYFRVAMKDSDKPLEDVVRDRRFANGWRICDPESILPTSATGYFFSRQLQERTGVPIGLLSSCVGGTSAQCWVPMEVLSGNSTFKPYLDTYSLACSNFPTANAQYKDDLAKWLTRQKSGEKNLPPAPRVPYGPTSLKRPACLYYAMIEPLTDLTIKGAIWYQGESDAAQPIAQPVLYRELFPALIRHWRAVWRQGDFPFYFVQLAGNMKTNAVPEDPKWACLRESQAMALSLTNTGMALALDAGLQNDIHPPFKQLVGERLCAIALHHLYGQDVACSGPLFTGLKIKGGKAVLSFANIGRGLVARGMTLDGNELPEGTLKGFAVCGEDHIFKWANAEIQGDHVIVSCPDVPSILAVRYGWANFPLCNLYNKEGFPAVPFRTDHEWPGAHK